MSVSISGTTGVTFPDLSVQESASSILPGTLIYFCASTAPTGYLKANGAAISRTTYGTLYAAIGVTFGSGDGTTTFNLPDARGYFLRGWADGVTTRDSGRVFGTTQTDAMQGHVHNYGQRNGVNGAGGGSYAWGISEGSNYGTTVPQTDGTNGTPRTAAETRPVNLALLACIKY